MRLRNALLIVAACSLASCGGSGGSNGGTPILNGTPVGTGVTASGAWMCVSSTGYFVNGAYHKFPLSEVHGAVAKVISAGGNYVWAAEQGDGPLGYLGTTILNLTTGKLVQVDKLWANIAGPNGTLGFGQIGNIAGQSDAFLTASGTQTPVSVPSSGLVPNVVSISASGWRLELQTTVGTGMSSPGAGYYPIPPSGVVGPVLPHLGSAYGAIGINDNGTSTGLDSQGPPNHQVAVTWSPTGVETVLPTFNSSATEEFGTYIDDNGDVLGGSAVNSQTTVVLWPAGGKPVSLMSLLNAPGKFALTQPIAIQSNGKILSYGFDASGTNAIVAIEPSGAGYVVDPSFTPIRFSG